MMDYRAVFIRQYGENLTLTCRSKPTLDLLIPLIFEHGPKDCLHVHLYTIKDGETVSNEIRERP